jgi:hypothetical protein
MTKRQLKIGAIIGGVGLGLWWLLKKNAGGTPAIETPSGDVTLGVPTVTGASATSGGTDYGTKSLGVDAVTGA